MIPRIASAVLVTALIRRAEADGGFGAVLARGDSSAGSILVVLLEKGANPRILERILQPNELYSWALAKAESAEDESEVPEFIARRRRFDPDLWVVELDIPSAERFAAEMNLLG